MRFENKTVYGIGVFAESFANRRDAFRRAV